MNARKINWEHPRQMEIRLRRMSRQRRVRIVFRQLAGFIDALWGGLIKPRRKPHAERNRIVWIDERRRALVPAQFGSAFPAVAALAPRRRQD